MAQTYDPIPGRVCSVSITSPGYLLPFTRFMWNEHCDWIDASAFTSQGFRELMAGMVSNSFTFAGIMGRQWNPFAGQPKLKIGTFVSNVRINLAGVMASNTPTAMVTDWQVGGIVQGEISYLCSLQSDWVFNDFSGSQA